MIPAGNVPARAISWRARRSRLVAYYRGEYDKKARELKERQTEIALRIEQHQKGEGDFRTRLESLISLRAADRWTGCGKWLMRLVGRRARSDWPWRRHDTRGKPRRSPGILPIVPSNGRARREFWAT
jgi:hypothetical protein